MDHPPVIARALAAAFLAGDFEVDGLTDRAGRLLGKQWRWIRPLARRVVQAFAGRIRPRQATLTAFLLSDHGFLRACQIYDLQLADRLLEPWTMQPVAAAESWSVPPIPSVASLSEWLGLTIGRLEWLADLRSLESKRSRGPLRHYHYRPLTKRYGRIRMIESPKPRLKEIQRQILAGILDRIPPHDAAHGFRRGRSIKTFAMPHVGKRVVVRIDLQDFFPSISAARVQSLFRTAGYPERVADLLAGLCTNATPGDAWKGTIRLPDGSTRQARWLYAQPHLPQGAPTSPALANLCAYRLDCRLAGLARSADADYTRYADDLVFSGGADFERAAKRFHLHSCAAAMEEGFTVHHRKTRIMKQGVCQRIAGIVVNRHPNVSRDDFDRLKAILTNCLRHGPQSQNRTAHEDFRRHLDGRISFVEQVNPAKAIRLRKLFGQIHWDE